MQNRYDVFGIGNAIVDTEVLVDDFLLTAHGLEKGVMTLVSTEAQLALLAGLAGHDQHGAAGGSAANTMVGVSQFGGSAFFSGKIGKDLSGALYRKSMSDVGVGFDFQAADSLPTGTCLILVTEDGERTMQTSLSAAAELGPHDVDATQIAASKYVYVEGYLFGSPTGAQAAIKSMEVAKEAGATVSLTLSDPGMAEHFIEPFKDATKKYVDVLFCNQFEAMIYAGTQNREAALKALGRDSTQVFMTCGGDGSMILDKGKMTHIPGYRVPVVDTTGAGDIYAAGVLYGLSHDIDIASAGKLGSFASARIVSQMGPRLSEHLGEHISLILDGAQPTDQL